MLKRFVATGAVLVMLITMLVVMVPVVRAQDTGTPANTSKSALSVSPAIVEDVLEAGKPTTRKIRVTNITKVPLPVASSVKNLTLQEELPPSADKDIYDASAWFALEPAEFILQPNQTKEITVRITPPAQASPGGHYATIYFQPLIPREALSPSTAYLNARVGVLSFSIVKGDITEEATAGTLGVPKLQQFGPVKVQVPVQNSGNVHLLPQGSVAILDWRGRKIDSLALPAGMVLPKTTRIFEIAWDNKGRIGKFSLQSDLRYGQDSIRIAGEQTEFWIVPWLPLGVLTILGLLIVGFVVRTRRRWKAAWQTLRGKA